MTGPLVVKMLLPGDNFEMIIVMEIDTASGRVLMQREAGPIEIHNLNNIKLVGDMKITRLMPPPGPRLGN